MTNEEAIKILSGAIKQPNPKDGYMGQALTMAIKALEQQPRGRWIDDKCSVCGKGIEDLISSSEWYRNEEPNFCPYCGARMTENEEEE